MPLGNRVRELRPARLGGEAGRGLLIEKEKLE
jgi:hypothetical protein